MIVSPSSLREELERWLSSGLLTYLRVSFSRLDPDGNPRSGTKYVQDSVRMEWEELAQWVSEDDAVVYVCG